MIRQRLSSSKIPEAVVRALIDRDAALWVGETFGADELAVKQLAALIGLPWGQVLCEPKSARLARVLEKELPGTSGYRRHRGGIHVIASDPRNLSLPRRCLPVYFLNGRDDATDREESSSLIGGAMQRRRLNMIDMLKTIGPKVVVVLSNGTEQPLASLMDLWQEGFRTQVVVVDSENRESTRLDNWVMTPEGPQVVDHLLLSLESLSSELGERLVAELTPDRLFIRVGDGKITLNVDITDCELAEQPMLDRYEVIPATSLHRRHPEDLTEEEFNTFFDRSRFCWKPYAAGLPWRRDTKASERIIRSLRQASDDPDEFPPIWFIASDTGAGGTTLARTLAFDAAMAGYPTLIAKSVLGRPEPTEVRKFLDRVRERISNEVRTRTDLPELTRLLDTPWLIVFDVEHWRGREGELRGFALEMVKSGRPVVFLLVRPPQTAELLRWVGAQNVATLNHEMSHEDVIDLGKHFNRFLRPLKRDRTARDWDRFWEVHRTNIETSLSAFWIALEFWLKRFIDLNETVQDWLYHQFREADIDDEMRLVLLEIAALSVEREPMPEGLLPQVSQGDLPWSIQLEQARNMLPALALVREVSASTRQWALLHDLIGRYLIRSVFFDRVMLGRLGYSDARDPMHLRLLLLRRVAQRSQIKNPSFLNLALEFAINILKLGNEGQVDFLPYWYEVLEILDGMPKELWNSSRTFNHHTAISRRRVVTVTNAFFDPTLEMKKQLLEDAVDDIEYALNDIPETDQDESNLNLFNSLALAYQNLAEVEREIGCSDERLIQLRKRATEAARNAQRENPSTSHVLETLARDLIQNGQYDSTVAVQNASEALGYIFEALQRATSDQPRVQLNRWAEKALALLQTPDASPTIERLCSQGNPLGFLARAMLVLNDYSECPELEPLGELTPEHAIAGLEALGPAQHLNHALVLRFRYDLVCRSAPFDFAQQLDLLDELDRADPRMAPQLILERAILDHQQNRHELAAREFDRLRKLFKRRDVFVDPPKRLRWLLEPGTKRPRLLKATVVPSEFGSRCWAKIREMRNLKAPFIPQEFGDARMRPGMPFDCSVAFGYKGPLIKLPRTGEVDS